MHLTQLGSAGFSNGTNIDYRQFCGSALVYMGKIRHKFNRQGLSAFGRVGIGILKNSSDGDIEFEQVNSTHMLYGVEFEYSGKGNLAARIEGYLFDEDMRHGQFSLIYRFGENKSTAVSTTLSVVELTEAGPVAPPALTSPQNSDHDWVANWQDQCPNSTSMLMVCEKERYYELE